MEPSSTSVTVTKSGQFGSIEPTITITGFSWGTITDLLTGVALKQLLKSNKPQQKSTKNFSFHIPHTLFFSNAYGYYFPLEKGKHKTP